MIKSDTVKSRTLKEFEKPDEPWRMGFSSQSSALSVTGMAEGDKKKQFGMYFIYIRKILKNQSGKTLNFAIFLIFSFKRH